MGMGLCPPGALLLQPEWDSSVPLGSWIIHHHQGSSSTAPQSSFPGEKGECQGCLQEVLMSRNPGQRDSTGNLCPGSCTCTVNPENPTYPTEQKWPLHAKASVQHAPGCRNECCPPVPGCLSVFYMGAPTLRWWVDLSPCIAHTSAAVLRDDSG